MDPSEAECAAGPKREPPSQSQSPVRNDNTTMKMVYEPFKAEDVANNFQEPRGRKRTTDEFSSDDEEQGTVLLEDGKTPMLDTGSSKNQGSFLNAPSFATDTQPSSSATTNPSTATPNSFLEPSLYEVMADQVLWRWLRSKVRERGIGSFGTPVREQIMCVILSMEEEDPDTIKYIQTQDRDCMEDMKEHLRQGVKNRKTPSETATTAQSDENSEPNYNSAWLDEAEKLNSDVIAVKLKLKEIEKKMSSKAATPPPPPEIDLRDPQAWMAKATKVKNDMVSVREKLEALNKEAADESGPPNLRDAQAWMAKSTKVKNYMASPRTKLEGLNKKSAKRWADSGKKLDKQKATNIAKGYTSTKKKATATITAKGYTTTKKQATATNNVKKIYTSKDKSVAPAGPVNEQEATATNIPKLAKGTFEAPAEPVREKKVKTSKIPKPVKELFVAPTKPIDKKAATVDTTDGTSTEKATTVETKDVPSSEALVVPSASTDIVPSLIAASSTPDTLYEKKGEIEKTKEIKDWVEKDESTTSQEDISNITTAFEEHTIIESIPHLLITPKKKHHEDDDFVEVNLTPPPAQPTFDEEADWVKLDESVDREPHEGEVEVMELPPADHSEHNGTFRRWYRFFRR